MKQKYTALSILSFTKVGLYRKDIHLVGAHQTDGYLAIKYLS